MSKKVFPLYNSTNMSNTDFPAPEKPAALKRNRRMRSNQGQLGAAIRKKGKDGHAAQMTTDEAEALEDCGASAFLISKF
jgi:cell division protein FtsN